MFRTLKNKVSPGPVYELHAICPCQPWPRWLHSLPGLWQWLSLPVGCLLSLTSQFKTQAPSCSITSSNTARHNRLHPPWTEVPSFFPPHGIRCVLAPATLSYLLISVFNM